MTTFPRLSTIERLQVTVLSTLPDIARGYAAPRPRLGAILGRLRVDRRMVELFDKLRRRYDGLPVWINSTGEPTLLILSPAYIERVLAGSDLLYTPDTRKKHQRLGVFQPDGLILSRGELRTRRRRFNEAILAYQQPRPAAADHLSDVVAEEIDAMLAGPASDGILDWRELERAFGRIWRRITFGDAAREDVELSRLLARLRRGADTVAAVPGARRRLAAWRREWEARIAGYAEAAPTTSLLGRVTDVYAPDDVRPFGQVPHWLMSLDTLGAVAGRALALVASHPAPFARVNEELAAADAHHGADTATSVAAQPYLEGCVLEAARLWPPVANLARATTGPVDWGGITLKAGTRLLIPTIHQHRSEDNGRRADHFMPEIWLDGTLDDAWTVLPFSLGNGKCAGISLATHLATAVCAAVLRRSYLRLAGPALAPDRRLPMALSTTDLRFAVGAKPRVATPAAVGDTTGTR